METKITSPIPKKSDKLPTMSFYEALQQLAEGKKIKRLEWDNANYPEAYMLLKDGKVQLYKAGKFYDVIINDGDLAGLDWIVLEGVN